MNFKGATSCQRWFTRGNADWDPFTRPLAVELAPHVFAHWPARMSWSSPGRSKSPNLRRTGRQLQLSFLIWRSSFNSTILSRFCGVLGKLRAIAEMVSLQYCKDMLTKNRKAQDLNIEFHGPKTGNFAMPKALSGEGFSTLIPKNAAFLGTCPFQLINTHQTSGSLRFFRPPSQALTTRIYDQNTFTWVPSRHTPMKEENIWPMDQFYIS